MAFQLYSLTLKEKESSKGVKDNRKIPLYTNSGENSEVVDIQDKNAEFSDQAAQKAQISDAE